MSDVTVYYRCTDCGLPCTPWLPLNNPTGGSTVRGTPVSPCCNAPVTVVGAKD